MTLSHLRSLILAFSAASVAACGFGPGYVPKVRYFEPVLPPNTPAPATDSSITLRLMPADAVDHLREPIVWRADDAERGRHEEWSWTEPPAHFVDRAIFDELFKDRGYQLFVTGNHPILRIIIWSFDEVRQPRHEAVVELYVGLEYVRDGRVHLELIETRAPIAGDDGADVARAMGTALAEAASRVGDWIEARWDKP